MKEYLIAPLRLKYPFEGRELTLYSMSEVAKVTINGKKYAKDTKGDNVISLHKLLPFEPYHNMGDLIWKFFIGETSAPVIPEELTQLAGKCHDKLADLKTAFKPDINSFQRECMKADCTEVERCVALFHILQRRGRFKTWRDFQQEFSRFSVFYLQVKGDIQKDMDTALGDDKHGSSFTSDSVTVSEDAPRSLPIRVPKSLTQPHTSTDSTSEIGKYSCRHQQTEIICRSLSGTADQRVAESEESHSQSLNQHIPHSSTGTSIGRYSC